MRIGGAGLGLLACTLLLGACVSATGPHIRVATATAAQLEAAENEDNVWYEFQPGDVVPVQFAYLGAVEGGSRGPSALRAKQHFYLVASKQGPMQISFDGKTYAGPNSSQSIVAVAPQRSGHGGQLVWIIYMGQSGDAKGELKKVLAESAASGK